MFASSAAPPLNYAFESNDMTSEDHVLDADDREYMQELSAKIKTPMWEADFKNLLTKFERVRKKLLKKREAKKEQRFKDAETEFLELLSDDDKENGLIVLWYVEIPFYFSIPKLFIILCDLSECVCVCFV